MSIPKLLSTNVSRKAPIKVHVNSQQINRQISSRRVELPKATPSIKLDGAKSKPVTACATVYWYD